MFDLSMLVVHIGLAYVNIDRYTSRHHDKEMKLTLQVVKILWVLSWPVAIAACEGTPQDLSVPYHGWPSSYPYIE
jgi:hypothetical protein